MERSRPGLPRRIAAGVIGVIAVILLLVTIIAVWARATVLDSDKVADLVTDALAEPEVSQALADHVATQVVSAANVDNAVSQALPPSLSRLEPVIASGVETAVTRGLDALLQTPAVQDELNRLVQRAHRAAIRLLDGDGLVDGITVADGEVTVNLLPLVDRGLGRLQQLGLLQSVNLPSASPDGDSAQQIADLEAALGRDLPDDFGQLVVYRSDRLADAQASVQSAQRMFALAQRAVWLLLVLTVVFLALAVLLAHNRWRAALLLGLGAVVAMVLARSAVRRVRDDAPALVLQPGAKAAVASLLGGASTSLLRILGLVLVVAVVVVAVAFVRRRWVRADIVAIAAVLAGVMLLGVLGFSLASLLIAVVVAVLAALAVNRFWPRRPTALPAV